MAEQITLKRASFYAKAALKAATDTKYDASLRLSIFAPSLTSDETTEISNEVSAARTKLMENHQLAIDLIAASYAIRAELAQTNLRHGVSALLTQNAQFGAEESRLRVMLALAELKDENLTSDTARAKAKSLRDKPAERYGREDTVTIGLLTETDAQALRKQLRRIVEERATINDALTALNVTHKITLDEKTEATLRRAEILSSK